MAFKVDRFQVELSRQARKNLTIHDTLSFIEDGDFLKEFASCGLTDEDRDSLESVITVCPTGGEVVPVSENVRDILYCMPNAEIVVIRYVYLRPSTVLLLQAYCSDESHEMTPEEVSEAERYISHQLEYFSTRFTR